MTGHISHLAGAAAEEIVATEYARRGFSEEKRRWRGPGGEVDLIMSREGKTVFVEVKKSKSFARAAERVSLRQLSRVQTSAEAYLGTRAFDPTYEAQIDVALVDAQGFVEILENVTMH